MKDSNKCEEGGKQQQQQQKDIENEGKICFNDSKCDMLPLFVLSLSSVNWCLNILSFTRNEKRKFQILYQTATMLNAYSDTFK